MRTRVFLHDTAGWRLACELEAEEPDDVWRDLERDPAPAGRRLAAGDVVYIGDVYWELDGDGAWRRIEPGPLTIELYRLATTR